MPRKIDNSNQFGGVSAQKLANLVGHDKLKNGPENRVKTDEWDLMSTKRHIRQRENYYDQVNSVRAAGRVALSETVESVF